MFTKQICWGRRRRVQELSWAWACSCWLHTDVVTQSLQLTLGGAESTGTIHVVVLANFLVGSAHIQQVLVRASFDIRQDGPIPQGGHLIVTRAPGQIYFNSPFGVQPVVSLVDANGQGLHVDGEIEATIVAGSGALIGTTTASMFDGTAAFFDLGYDTAESGVVLRATLGDLLIEFAPLNVQDPPPGHCTLHDDFFHTADGGCMSDETGLVWSAVAAGGIGPGKASWNALQANASTQDAWDYGRTNDYGPSVDAAVVALQEDPTSHCHDLVEGGQSRTCAICAMTM